MAVVYSAVQGRSQWYYDKRLWGEDVQFRLQGFFRALSGTVRLRVVRTDTGAAVTGLNVETSSGSLTTVRSSAVAQSELTDQKYYQVEVGLDSGDEADIQDARIVADNAAV